MRTIIGAAKVFDNKYMRQGRGLEKKMLSTVMQNCGFKYRKSGLTLLPQFPVLGASRDAIGVDFIMETKCLAKETSILNYLKDGNISEKCKAQIQLQMV